MQRKTTNRRRRSPYCRTIATTLAIAMCAVCCGHAVASQIADILEDAKLSPQLGESVPLDLQFRDSTGKTVRLAEFFGEKPVVLHLVYYGCPMLCRLAADGLQESLEKLELNVGNEFDIITLSFHPDEGPELAASARQRMLEEYNRESADRGWHFLTGDKTSIVALCEAVGFRYAWDQQKQQYAHGAGIFVLTPDGTVSRFLGGIEYPPRDMRLSIVEASQGKVGTATDQLLLLCYAYDPVTGKYGFAIISTVRALGIVTVITIIGGIIVMRRRERRGEFEKEEWHAEAQGSQRKMGRT